MYHGSFATGKVLYHAPDDDNAAHGAAAAAAVAANATGSAAAAAAMPSLIPRENFQFSDILHSSTHIVPSQPVTVFHQTTGTERTPRCATRHVARPYTQREPRGEREDTH